MAVPIYPMGMYSSGSQQNRWLVEREALSARLGEPITLDALTGPQGIDRMPDAALIDDSGAESGWLIAQRKRGHRHSIDDVLTAWFALQVCPKVRRHLDLGTGIGTVGLLVLWGMGEGASLVGVEAQEISFYLLQSNLRMNGLEDRVDSIHGDLRDLALQERFPLITGSPPYFPPGAGVLPQDSQKAHARFELRGDVYDYAKAAKRHMNPDGWFIFCFPYPQRERALRAIEDSELILVKTLDVIPRETLPPLFSLFACRHREAEATSHAPSSLSKTQPLTVRHENGRLTAKMAAVRRVFGFSDSAAHGGHGEDPELI